MVHYVIVDGGQDTDEDRHGGLGSSINPLFLRIADLFNITTAGGGKLRSPTSSTSGREHTSDDENTDEEEDGDDHDNDNDNIDIDETNESKKGPEFGPDRKKDKGQGKGKKKRVSSSPPVVSQGKYSIDTNDITVVKKNMFREGKVHFYTASLPGFI